VASPHSVAALLFDSVAVSPGTTFRAGLQIRLDKGWHTYWKNPGDSGTEVRLTWTLPEGVEAGGLAWPVPERLEKEGLVSYAYYDTVTLLSQIHVSKSLAVGSVQTLKAKATWLVCEEACLPAEATFEVPLRIGEVRVSQPTETLAIFDAAQKALPRRWDAGNARMMETSDHYEVVLSSRLETPFKYRMFLPDPGVPVTYAWPLVVETKADSASQSLTLRFEKGTMAPAPKTGALPTQVTGLLVTESGAFEVDAEHYASAHAGTMASPQNPLGTTTKHMPQVLPAATPPTADLALMSAFAMGGGI
jgi:DsbC/DsbD-like thiol-disulfide interchange protein